ncbi:GerMN domain-containing protein [Patescibacteria group bacterium]|nr:GerMN domain-containing protein [Patescibacteria group bacterium]
MKKIIILGAMFLGIVFVAGCGQQPIVLVQPIEPTTSTPVVVAPSPTQPDQDIAYNNQTFGFALTFPQTWEDFYASEQEYDSYSSVCFSFKQPQPFCIFQIVKYNKSQWEQMKFKYAENILSEIGDSVIICDGCCKEGGDTSGGGQFNQFQIDRCKEVPDIIETYTQIARVTSKMDIFVLFPNSQLDPNMLNCMKVFRTTRTIDETLAVGRAALEELFKGPTAQETQDGYFTNIPTGVKIQKLTIENGVAKVDLSKELEQGVGGSCRVDSIRAQITETLKQFPTVQSVIISINGETENILQP